MLLQKSHHRTRPTTKRHRSTSPPHPQTSIRASHTKQQAVAQFGSWGSEFKASSRVFPQARQLPTTTIYNTMQPLHQLRHRSRHHLTRKFQSTMPTSHTPLTNCYRNLHIQHQNTRSQHQLQQQLSINSTNSPLPQDTFRNHQFRPRRSHHHQEHSHKAKSTRSKAPLHTYQGTSKALQLHHFTHHSNRIQVHRLNLRPPQAQATQRPTRQRSLPRKKQSNQETNTSQRAIKYLQRYTLLQEKILQSRRDNLRTRRVAVTTVYKHHCSYNSSK